MGTNWGLSRLEKQRTSKYHPKGAESSSLFCFLVGFSLITTTNSPSAKLCFFDAPGGKKKDNKNTKQTSFFFVCMFLYV